MARRKATRRSSWSATFSAALICLNSLYGLGPDADRTFPKQIEAIERDDVLRVAQRFIKLGAYTISIVRP